MLAPVPATRGTNMTKVNMVGPYFLKLLTVEWRRQTIKGIINDVWLKLPNTNTRET